MQINNNYSPNFSGTFRIQPQEVRATLELPRIFTKHRQIFRNIQDQGDMFIVLRDCADRKFVKYIKNNDIQGVEYYPLINTKSGLDDEQPELLKTLLKSEYGKSYTTVKEIKERAKFAIGNANPNDTKEQLSKVINCMRLNIEEPKVTITDKMATVRDEAKKRTLYVISPNGSINYAYLWYDNPNYDSVRCTIDNEGKIIKEYIDLKDFLAFDKKFKSLANSEVNRFR